MSYIRCTSNPEGLYVWSSVKGIEFWSERGQFILPVKDFRKLMKKWLDKRSSCTVGKLTLKEHPIHPDGTNCKCKFTSLLGIPPDNHRQYKWQLKKGRVVVSNMYQVTLFYLASHGP